MGGEPHVVIVGGGFGGLNAARTLKKAPVRVTVMDRRNFHLFQPLLYQVATASLSPADIASPIRTVLRRQRNAQVWMADVSDVDVAAREIQLKDGTKTHYDYLVLATGATHSYFGHDEWAAHAPGLKTVDDATEMRRRFLLAFESAEREADVEARRRLLTFVIVGAGPTGVELAGAMAEIARQVMPQDFRAIDTTTTRILLMEGLDRVLPTYPPDLSEKARRQLERLGVEVRTGTLVTDIGDGYVCVGDERIGVENVFWAAGVSASKLGRRLGVETDRAGRVAVEPDCSVPGHPEVFVIGDLASMRNPDGTPVPGVAQGAIQSGKHVARQILRDLKQQPRQPFRYFDKGDLATIGRAAAVARLGKLHLSGYPAWLIWVFVHITYLIGFRNRLLVMLQWAWAYLTYHRGIRLITGNVELDIERARDAEDPLVSVSRGRRRAHGR
ncbi:MAG TPA: NAD(P)/FAD-dependent oxidoreductase [Longimicrobiales bacterium]|nr:NAD(P)/FAD-dependent oxidoreductase [Longimicrobiales bacterium]